MPGIFFNLVVNDLFYYVNFQYDSFFIEETRKFKSFSYFYLK